METYRLKNIAIVLLLLLNGSLLLLVGYQRFQEAQTEQETAQRLRELCEASQLALSGDLDLTRQPLDTLVISRREESEQAIASCLLDGEAKAASQGGGIYSYGAASGSIQFRAGGSFYGSRLSVPVADVADFCQTFFRQFGYEQLRSNAEDGTGSVTAIQRAAGVDIIGSEVTLRFEEGALVSVTGSHINLESASTEPDAEEMTCVTALVRFLDYRNASGAVCSEVRDVHCVYQLQGAAAPRLLPVWQIDTDTNAYFVDCRTGDVTVKT
ncbi:MAG: hypothetical protein K2N78_05315 [Oscillospiraceae bacterium]|nr:hypothetical protein [Oscillospiraceae bacterium]